MKYFSMFSGIGGFELGIGDRGGCIGYSEIDKYAISVYEKHYNHKNYGSAKTIEPTELPDFDLICGGFPCQSFSIAGKRGGFDDTRGTLFFDIARIARVKRPRLLFLENVKGLLSHDGGRTFDTIIRTLDELGYDCQWQVLNSKNFGVPQNRERVFIIGHLRGTSRPQVFPFIGEGETTVSKSIIVGNTNRNQRERGNVYDSRGTVGALTATDYKQPKQVQVADYRTDEGLRIRKDFISNTLQAQARQDGTAGQPLLLITNTKKGYDEVNNGDGINLSFPKSKTRRGRVIKKNSPTLQANSQIGTVQDMKMRRLTPKECERLQGFPDDWTKWNKEGKEVADTQRYKMCGNAVTVNVIKYIAELLL